MQGVRFEDRVQPRHLHVAVVHAPRLRAPMQAAAKELEERCVAREPAGNDLEPGAVLERYVSEPREARVAFGLAVPEQAELSAWKHAGI